jgi:cell division protease FtsH
VKLDAAVDLHSLAARTPGFAGADLANLVNEATLRAAKRGHDTVQMVDFEDALDRIVAGLEKKNRVMNPKEKEFVAVHEAGHALVAENRPNADRVAKISIIPRGIGALGYTQQQPTEDRYLLRRSELLDRLDVLLAGRVAEQLVFQDVSTGAQNDLQRATEMARHMVTQYGMSEKLGLATYDTQPVSMFLDAAAIPERRNCSEHTAEVIDQEVQALLADARARVEHTLREHRPALDALSRLLLDTEVVDRAMLESVLAGKALTDPAADREEALCET